MSDYKTTRIQNAIKENPDSPAKVRQTVMKWALEDQKFLTELVKPHLSGIVSYAVYRVENKLNEPEMPVPATPADALAEEEGNFGLEILKTIAGGHSAIFGLEGRATGKKEGVSQKHIDAINAIAGKGKPKK